MLIDIKNSLRDIHKFQVIKQDEKLKLYETLFEPIRKEYLNILELGIHTGGSLLLWETYFPNATVYGVDISLSKVEIPNTNRIKMFECSQTDLQKLDEIVHTMDRSSIDILIDDGSHMCDDIVESLEFLLPKTNKFYINEDICVGENWNNKLNKSKWYNGQPGYSIRDYFNDFRDNHSIRDKYNIMDIEEVEGKFHLIKK